MKIPGDSRRVPVLVLLLVLDVALTGAGCGAPPEAREREARDRADRLAQAFYRYVDVHYGARLAAEKNVPGPPPATRLRVREDLVHALRDVGADLPDASDDASALKAAVHAVRETLAGHDYVFLPLGQGAETDNVDQGIALARVRERDPARSLELWGRRVEFKRILFDPFISDYFAWRANALHEEGPVYSPGRYSGSTVYIDFPVLSRHANNLKPPLDKLGLEGLVREVELRQAAYLLFMRDIPQAATGDEAERRRVTVRLHERVLWTVARYGDPDLALVDIDGLAAGNPPAELKEAALRVQALIPKGTRDLLSKTTRAEVLHNLADEVWPRMRAHE